ncbi:putative sulfatase domain-containing protein [Neofusicoccum parvum UCRNP2]|uniref:Putative sulfatase domain-containing protein n=1 Tax=Botryosphaeria parva (strain UCR-NP2) TaxID=1287680 RepID=R1G4M5_BOTPV|nr:putative sulfatase domain-containing protein [Neofusicoccum parvum UCRNP2]
MEPGAIWPLSVLLRTKDQFALFTVSSFAAKLLHLYSHRASLPILLIVLYTPTFLLPDLLLLLFGKLVVYRPNRGRAWKICGGLLALLTAATSASQISFYIETGGEVQWMAAGNLAMDPGGLRMILSELPKFATFILAFSAVAWLVAARFYTAVGGVLHTVGLSFRQMHRCLRGKSQLTGYEELDGTCDVDVDPSKSDERTAIPSLRKAAAISVGVIAAIVTVLVLQIVRPRTPPYAHMSGSLPITLFESFFFNPINPDFCLPHPHHRVEFPFEDYARISGHALPSDWKPLTEESALKQNHPSIKNVLLITLESTRKDMFPFKKDSGIYNAILSSYNSPDASVELDKKIRDLTETTAFLTRESTNFDQTAYNASGLGAWTSKFNDTMGGINVQGAITGSAFTLKSLLTSLCGVDPLPVDFTEEVKGRIYQPCLPQILDLFNKAELDDSAQSDSVETIGKENFLSWPWDSAMVQSVTDQFDSQYTLDEQIGFRTQILEATISNPASKHFPPKEPKSNYFGYPETEALPFLRDLFVEAKQQKRRLFVSHLTSSTHHPFAVPQSWTEQETYLSKKRFRPEDELDRYLNTIRYQDGYINQIFTMLDEVDALNETLVVMTGDHGLAFNTPDGSHSTFENGHVSNFAIPLLFAHPSLPRIQVSAQTTPTSIIPTILDLLMQTHSLSGAETDVAKRLLPHYQGQSMIRQQEWSVPVTSPADRHPHDHGPPSSWTNLTTAPAGPGLHPWHFSIINPGGSLLAVSRAHSPLRLVLPLCSTHGLRFTDTAADPGERRAPLLAWSVDALLRQVRARHGADAAEWARLAERLGRWWFWEQRRRWGYHYAARSTDRGAVEGGGGRIRKAHWWET